MQYRRERCNCNICPLNGMNKVFSIANDDAKIAILAEAPGAAEDESGIPLSGPSGRMFNLGLYRAGLHRDQLWIANTILCRPPSNEISSPEGVAAVSCCRNGLNDELRAMRNRGIRVIGALGSTATHQLGIEGAIGKIRGSVYIHTPTGIFIVPMLHPAAIMRGGAGGTRKSGISALAAFISDLIKLKEISVAGWVPPKEKFNIHPTLQDVTKFVDDALASNALIAVDIETTGLSAQRGAQIVVIGLASSTERAIVVPLLGAHGIPYWQNGSAQECKDVLNRLFRSGRFVLQNCFFDVPFLHYHGYEISVDNVEHDTMVLHSLISPETEHNLGYIVSIYGQTPEWKESFKHREQSILEMDQDEMRTYNARDCVVLHQVLPPMLRDLEAAGLSDFYATETRPLMRPFMQMTTAGVAFDVAHMTRFKALIKGIVDQKSQELHDAYSLPATFSLDNIDEVRWLMFSQRPTKASRLRSTLVTYEKELKGGKIKQATKLFVGQKPAEVAAAEMPPRVVSVEEVATLDYKKAGTAIAEELASITALMQLQPLYHLSSYRGAQTDSEKAKMSRDALLSYRIALNGRLDTISKLAKPEARAAEVVEIEEVLAFMEAYSDYKEKQKLVTSFTKYGADPDGRVRASWLMHGTATGRLSCKQPNLAQLPARGEGKEVRKFFIAPPASKIIDADYENAEVALLGYEAQDDVIIDIYEQKRNIHTENAQFLFNLKPVDDKDDPSYEVWKQARDAAKIFQFGGLSYGGQPRTIHRQMVMKAPKLNLTFAQVDGAMKDWMAVHPAYVEWRAAITNEVLTQRKLTNAFGRRRVFLGHPRDIVKEGMNFMIQSSGACLINRAMIRLFDRFQASKMKTRIIMQIYDEIVLESPDEEVTEASTMLIEEMTRPFEMHGRTCILRAEASSGQTYGDAK